MKVLHFEDTSSKYMDIRSVLKSNNIDDVIWVKNLEDGINKIEEINNKQDQFDFIITDMHFPLEDGGEPDWEAGERLVKYVIENELNIPVVVMSSVNLKIEGATKCLWYNNLSEWENDLRKLLRKYR